MWLTEVFKVQHEAFCEVNSEQSLAKLSVFSAQTPGHLFLGVPTATYDILHTQAI